MEVVVGRRFRVVREIPGFRNLSHELSRRQRVGDGWLDGEDRLTPESCFLDGFVEDMGDCIASEIAVSRVWADGGVIGKAVEDLPTQGALRVFVQEGDAEGETSELGSPTSQCPALETWCMSR